MATRREVLSWLSVLVMAGTLGRVTSLQGGTRDAPLDVVVVGGGMSGLTAAWLIKNKNVLVLERQSIPGGRTISGTWGGFSYPKGTEYIGPPEGFLESLFTALKLVPFPIPLPQAAVAYEGKIYSGTKILGFLPDQAISDGYDRIAAELMRLEKTGINEDALFTGVTALEQFADLDRISVSTWLEQQKAPALAAQVIDVENRGLFGAGNADFSMLFNLPETAWNMFDDTVETEADGMWTFPKGMSEVIDALAVALGDRLQTGSEVIKVVVEKSDLVAVTYRRAGREETVWGKQVLFTSPAPVTARLAGAGLSTTVRGALNSIRYTPYIVVNLFTSTRIWKEAWTLSSLDDYFVTLYDVVRTQTTATYDGPSILGIYLAPTKADDVSFLALSETDVMAKIMQGLLRYDPDINAKVLGHDLYRIRHAFPVFRPGYLDILRILEQDTSVHGPIYLAGDYTVYPTFDGAAISALQAVKSMGFGESLSI